jgi:hypothetical protein
MIDIWIRYILESGFKYYVRDLCITFYCLNATQLCQLDTCSLLISNNYYRLMFSELMLNTISQTQKTQKD